MSHQRWQEAGSVSKIRSVRIIIVIGLVTIIFQIIGHQQSSYGQVTADTLIIEVSNDGEATVTQELTPSTTVSRVTVNPIAKDLSDVLAVDENKVVLSFSTSADIITIDTLGSANVTLTYGA
jgi:hypothetical protein